VTPALREEFPLLSTCTYLNSNAAGAVPSGVQSVLSTYGSSLFRYRDEIWLSWWESLRRYERNLAELIGAQPGTIALDGNVSTLLGRLLSSFDFAMSRRRIVTTDHEFPSTRFIARAHEKRGAVVDVVRSFGIAVDEDAVIEAIDEQTAVVIVSLATYATGAITDVARIARRARAMGALTVVDAYAAIGVVPVNVAALGADVVLGGAHKWLCGSYESAFMYVSPSILRELEPAATGWMAAEAPLTFAEPTRYADDARRFTAGTPAVLPALLSEVGLQILRRTSMADIRATSLRRTKRILERAREAGIEPASPLDDDRRAGIAALRVGPEVQRSLAERGFVCSYRGVLRVGPHFYNTDDEVERFLDALITIVGHAR